MAREIDEDNHSDAGKTVDILEIINANDRLLDMIPVLCWMDLMDGMQMTLHHNHWQQH